MESLSKFCSSVIEYETPKVVTVHNLTIGLLRRCLQLGVILYVGVYQLWYAQGYQEFAGMESSVTSKVLHLDGDIIVIICPAQVKGYSQSSLGTELPSLPPHQC